MLYNSFLARYLPNLTHVLDIKEVKRFLGQILQVIVTNLVMKVVTRTKARKEY